MSEKENKKAPEEIFCPGCGRKANLSRDHFCRTCGRELRTPVIDRQSSIKILLVIILIVAVFYVLYLLIKEPLFYWLDKVPHIR